MVEAKTEPCEWRTLGSKFLKNFSQSSGKLIEPQQLCCYYNNYFIAWSDREASLYAIDINDQTNHCYELKLSQKVRFRVSRVQASSAGNILLHGSHGVCVVLLPENIAFAKDDVVPCRCFPLGELLLLQTPELEIVQAKWFPSSPDFVAVLLIDSTICTFNITSKTTQPTETIQVLRGSESQKRRSFLEGERIKDFDFSSPSEIFCVSSSAQIYKVTNVSTTRTMQKMKVHGPLDILPVSDDNHCSTSATFSIQCLSNESSTLLAVAGSKGIIYHYLVVDDIDEGAELFFIEKVKLNFTATETVGDFYPILLEKDLSVRNRYFCLHAAGLHVVVLPFAELLCKFAQQNVSVNADDFLYSENARCLVENVVCTRATDKCDGGFLLGATVVPTFPSPKLLVVTSDLKMIDIPLTRYRITDVPEFENLLSDEKVGSPEDLTTQLGSENFEQKVKTILIGSRMPVWAQSSKVNDHKELLEATLKATQNFRDGYLLKMNAVSKIIDWKSKSLREAKIEQQNEFERIREEIRTIDERSKTLDQTFEEVESRSRDQNVRLHEIIKRFQSRNPSSVNTQVENEVRALNERAKRLESVLETTMTRFDDLKLAENAEIGEKPRESSMKLSEAQLSMLNERMKHSTHSITSLTKLLKGMLDEIETY